MAAAAKQAPDTISYGTGGIGSLAHVSTVLLQQLGDFKLTHVPYRGGGPAIQRCCPENCHSWSRRFRG